MNGITFSDEEWDGLYQAMQLKRAVERFEIWLKEQPERSYTTTMRAAGDHGVYVGGRYCASLAAALIALAGEGKE